MNYYSDINLYKKFYVVAKCGSFVKAAQDMYITQPALSKSIKQLEDNLNTKLLYRTAKGVKLTEEGKELLKYVDESLNLLSIGEKNIKENHDLQKGELSIGIQSHLAQFFLFPYIKKFKKMYPGIKINIRSRNTSELLEQLEENKVDFVIDTSPIESIYNNLQIKELFELTNCFISYKKEDITTLKELEKENLILPVRTSTPRKQLNKFLNERDIWFEPIMTIETTGALKNAVKEKMGIGYLLEVAVTKDIERGELYKINLNEELPKLKLNLIYIDKYLTKIPTTFIDMIKEDYSENI